MDHIPFYRILPGSKNAVLMIHGIAGTPAQFQDLIPMVPPDWSIYDILLDGHCARVEDFGTSSMKKWKAQAAAQVEEMLQNHERIVLVGHSMGTLFSIRAGIEHPDRVAGLFLIAVPLRPWVRLSTVFTCLRVMWGDLRPDDKAGWAMRNATGIQMTRKFWKYASWIPRLLELLTECRVIREMLPRLEVPTLAFQSRIDELVSMRSVKHLRTNPNIRITVLEDSGHFAYGPEDKKRMQEAFVRFLT